MVHKIKTNGDEHQDSQDDKTQTPIAYEAYQQLADYFAAMVDTKPHNAFYDRPAMIGMWPELKGKRVLDAGCGPGAYAEELIRRGAVLTAIDASDRMLELARQRLGDDADLHQVNMELPLDMFEPNEFDLINAPLCLDYIQNWKSLFSEFERILKPGGQFQFSCGHPSFDAEYFDTDNYFSVEKVECKFKGFGPHVVVPTYRRSLQEIMMPLLEEGFRITEILEPLPTDEFMESDPDGYRKLMHRPGFLCVKASKPLD